jgi:hypothetical protein
MQSRIGRAGHDMKRFMHTWLLSLSIVGILTSFAGPIFSPLGWNMPDEVLPYYALAPLAILMGLVIRKRLLVLFLVPPFVALWIYRGFTWSPSLAESSLLGFLSATLLLSLTKNREKNLLFPFFSTVISFACITATIDGVLGILRGYPLETAVSYSASYDVLKISFPVMIAWQLSPLFLAALGFLGIIAKMRIFSLYGIITFISLLIILPFFFNPRPLSFITGFVLFMNELPTLMVLGLMSGLIAWPSFTVLSNSEHD